MYTILECQVKAKLHFKIPIKVIKLGYKDQHFQLQYCLFLFFYIFCEILNFTPLQSACAFCRQTTGKCIKKKHQHNLKMLNLVGELMHWCALICSGQVR